MDERDNLHVLFGSEKETGVLSIPKMFDVGLKIENSNTKRMAQVKSGNKTSHQKSSATKLDAVFSGSSEPGSTQSDSLDRLKMVKGKSLRSTNKAPVFKQNL